MPTSGLSKPEVRGGLNTRSTYAGAARSGCIRQAHPAGYLEPRTIAGTISSASRQGVRRFNAAGPSLIWATLCRAGRKQVMGQFESVGYANGSRLERAGYDFRFQGKTGNRAEFPCI